jgi:hypothetical protein
MAICSQSEQFSPPDAIPAESTAPVLIGENTLAAPGQKSGFHTPYIHPVMRKKYKMLEIGLN